MKRHSPRLIAATALAACVASLGCYPAYNNGTAYNQDAQDYSVPQQPYPQQSPGYVGVDPVLAVAGVAAAGLLGYAIANNRGYHHSYYGPGYYRPAYYGRGYYGPRCY
jgi:hypothetical protein